MTRRLIVIFSSLVLLCGMVFVGTLIWGGRSKNIDSVLQRYEFTELVPPSTLAPPGTLVTIIKENPLVVGIICPASESLGEKLQAHLATSDSSTSQEAEELTGEFKLDVGGQKYLKSGVDTKYVKNISVTLSNVKLIEIPDSLVFELISDRKSSCAKAVEFRRKNGQKISMIKSVIQASALFKVDFDGSVDANTRAQLTRGIASSLGLTNGAKSEDTIQGDGLYWGVRDDESLATVSATEAPPTGSGIHPQVLPTDRSAQILPNGDPE